MRYARNQTFLGFPCNVGRRSKPRKPTPKPAKYGRAQKQFSFMNVYNLSDDDIRVISDWFTRYQYQSLWELTA